MNCTVRVLSYPQLKSEKGVRFSRQYLGRLERAGRFPRRFRIGANTVAWLESEVDAWLAARIAEREGGR